MAMIGTTAALYAHAIAIEREAVERYAEFAARMSDLGNEDVARLFTALARTETDHLKKLEAQAGRLALPATDGIEHAWLDYGATSAPARELVYRTMGPREALSIALASEQRAQALFLRVQRLPAHPAQRALAPELCVLE